MKKRVYVCHTFYHVYVACLKECYLPISERGNADLVLSTMSNDFGDLKERVVESELFDEVFLFEEKEDVQFPELTKYHVDRGNLLINMLARIRYTKLLGKLQEPYVPVDFRSYEDVYVFCDSDPIGYYLSYKKIRYHALEDGLDCIRYYDTARYDNKGHFRLKAFLSSINLIFIQNGYGKYCIDMEVNDISVCPYPCPKYVELRRELLVEHLSQDDKDQIVKLFLKNIDELKERFISGENHEHKVLILTEPLCSLEVREKIFRDVISEQGQNAQVILKPHPRDVLDYEKLFPEYIVLSGKFPMEIMNFIPELQVDKVVSILTVPDGIHFAKEVVFLGEDYMDRYEARELHSQNEYLE
ncbi:MAG: lipooligosaccharide sialyltransferase [Lachnospiraceae bacterium]|nr:lipooligosaccharide sialyltransferase [Lachnospiraceae bacterium]